LAIVITGGLFLQQAVADDSGDPAAAPATASAHEEVASVTASGLAPVHAPSIRATLRPGDAVLTSMVDNLAVFDAPGGAVARELDRYTRYSLPLTLMAIDDADVAGETWYHVSLPAKPNGQTGWVRASDVMVSSTDVAIRVYLAEHELDVVVDGEVVLTAPVAVGDPATPTPLGTFYITDPIDLAGNPTGVYGAYALGLSGYSEALDSFKGTSPQIAIHGTNQPRFIGQSVSNGCIRMNNNDVVAVAAHVGLGTPVVVSSSRADA
jgi:lipoprotein-anchoring transpeptidase ErfK/SrfK